MTTIEKQVAKFISVLFHPLFMPVYGLWVLFSLNSFLTHQLPYEMKLLLLAIIFVLTALVPAIFMFFLKSAGYISSLTIENKSQRTIPYLITLLFYASAYFSLIRNEVPQVIIVFILGACAIIITTMLINFIWKISAHMMAMGALVGAVYAMGLRFDLNTVFVLLLTVLISGWVGFARLALKAHTPAQTYIGFILGFTIQVIIFMQLV